MQKWPEDFSFTFCRRHSPILQANKGDLDVIQGILVLYEKASGQKLNREKTTVFFSKATSEEKKLEIIEALGVSEVKEYEKYLGLRR